MAKIIAHVLGGTPTEKEASTVAELKSQLQLANYSAKVNKEPVDDSYELEEGDLVTFAQQVKGARGSLVSRTAKTVLYRMV
jgi:hypothetical protein